MITLNGQRVLITGAGGNIGSGIARRFAAAGAEVIAHYHRSADEAAALAEEIRGTTTQADLTNPAQLQAMVDEVGPVDVLVNNAAVQTVRPLKDTTAEDWREIIDANLNAVFALTQAVVRTMIPTERGSVITIASVEGTNPAEGHAAYATAKAAVLMHTKAAALEYGRFGIRCNAVSPGLIGRPGIEEQWPEGVRRWHAAAPLHRLGTPEDVGNACVFLASPLAEWITGQNLTVDGGVSTHPTW
ncbi:SDR family NAD(P)-dependent oxidoreductase [Allokutzneria sp. A3M-2-11 16]|uniref:SDR family NAD(P)-dependent oxidoreductase n=1 Tax=Allokutzneria sp. A3M-2-11 16 TaxID=2962043 RepID=UPI0035A92D74